MVLILIGIKIYGLFLVKYWLMDYVSMLKLLNDRWSVVNVYEQTDVYFKTTSHSVVNFTSYLIRFVLQCLLFRIKGENNSILLLILFNAHSRSLGVCFRQIFFKDRQCFS